MNPITTRVVDAGEMRALPRSSVIPGLQGARRHARTGVIAFMVSADCRDVAMHQVLDAEDADDLVARAAEGREPAERTGRDDVERVRPRRRDVDHRQAIARDHQVARGGPAEPQRFLQPLLLVWLEQPAIAALRDEQRNLVRRVQVPVPAHVHAEEAEQSGSRAVQ
jgi:hypothetical protein